MSVKQPVPAQTGQMPGDLHSYCAANTSNVGRCHLHCANEAVGAGLVIHAMLGQPKVCHFDVALAVQKHILLKGNTVLIISLRQLRYQDLLGVCS